MSSFVNKKMTSTDVNNGQQYENNDGITPNDLNSIVEGVMYLNDNIDNSTIAINKSKQIPVSIETTASLPTTGNTNTYLVTATNHWYYWNGTAWNDGGIYQTVELSDETVKPSKTTFVEYEYGLNVFNKDLPKENGYYLANGNIAPNNSYVSYTDFMKIKPSTSYNASLWNKTNGLYYLNNNSVNIVRIIEYDGNYNQIKYLADQRVYTSSSNAEYIKITLQANVVTEPFYTLMNEGTVPLSTYFGYSGKWNIDKHYTTPRINKITVSASGGGNFTKLQDAFNFISNASISNQYIIYLHEGNYNIASDFTEAQISNSSFRGVTIPNYTTIIGVGNRKNIIVDCSFDSPNNHISTIHTLDNCIVENVTFTSTNCRYTLHMDAYSSDRENTTIKFKNCYFKGNKSVYSVVCGCGMHENDNWIFENCIFDGTNVTPNGGNGGIPYYVHNSTNWEKPSYIKFVSCKFITSRNDGALQFLSINNNASKSYIYASVYGCKLGTGTNGFQLGESGATTYGAGLKTYVSGYANTNNNVKFSNTDTDNDYSYLINLI